MTTKFWNKTEELLLYFFIFALPLQLRVVFLEQDWIFNEWRSASLYATDVLFAGLMLFWLFRLMRARGDEHFIFDSADKALIIFLAAATVSLRYPYVAAVSEFQLLKLFQGAVLFFYLKYYAVRRFEARAALVALIAGGVFQSVIAIGQFFRQSDLGLQFIGESMIIPEMQGVAVFFNAAGEKIMRAYGTVPHPNILAAYLLVAIIALYYLYLNSKRFSPSQYSLFVTSYAVILFAFWLTFSRTTIFVWALALAVLAVSLWRRKFERKKLFHIVLATSVLGAVFAGLYWPEIVARLTISTQEEAVTLRLYYNKTALKVPGGSSGDLGVLSFLEPVLAPVLRLNWTGIGIGNFMNWFMFYYPNLPRHYYQPAHNIYLLMYSEIGILGVGAFLAFLTILGKRYFVAQASDIAGKLCLGLACATLLFIGFFDHFPWTLQQGRFLLWGTLGLAAGLTNHKRLL